MAVTGSEAEAAIALADQLAAQVGPNLVHVAVGVQLHIGGAAMLRWQASCRSWQQAALLPD